LAYDAASAGKLGCWREGQCCNNHIFNVLLFAAESGKRRQTAPKNDIIFITKNGVLCEKTRGRSQKNFRQFK
jgi:hypothetical protein